MDFQSKNVLPTRYKVLPGFFFQLKKEESKVQLKNVRLEGQSRFSKAHLKEYSCRGFVLSVAAPSEKEKPLEALEQQSAVSIPAGFLLEVAVPV